MILGPNGMPIAGSANATVGRGMMRGAGARNAAMFGVKRIPSEYQEVEYIESSGDKYIDTGVIENHLTYYDVTLCLLNNTKDQFAIGGSYFPNGTANRIGYYSVNGKMYTQANDSGAVFSDAHIMVGVFYRAITNHNLFIFEESQSNISFTKDNNSHVFLFATPTPSSEHIKIYEFSLVGRIKTCKITQSDEVVRDYVPCFRKSDEVAGMYDLIHGSFSYGTGGFVPGPIV